MNIVVLYGGNSAERDVSILSGKKISKALISVGHNVKLLDICNDIKDKNKDVLYHLHNNLFGSGILEECKQADIVFLALHGGSGEDGKIQKVFDTMNIKYTGTGPLGSGRAMNKGITKRIFDANNIPNPKGKVVKAEDIYKIDYTDIGFPMVIKPCNGGSSIGVYILRNEKELNDIFKNKVKYDKEYVIEEYIKGREFAVGVLGKKALPVIEIIPKQGFYDYKNKYIPGLTKEICPADIDEKLTIRLQKLAIQAHKALQLDVYSRMDFIVKEDNSIYCLEANTLPGMTITSLIPQEAQAIGMSYNNLCEKIIELSLLKEIK